ncbi:MAG: hypothetical protein NW205_09500 [Hyphomicrobiaceae bacterium]|nr:hypothetical protein [Hyphomicrobiaceae bacterium]
MIAPRAGRFPAHRRWGLALNSCSAYGLVAGLALLVSGCASSLDSSLPAASFEGGTYRLSEEEAALDCRKITGRMQVRILQIRDYEERRQTSALSKTMQNAARPVVGGTQIGVAPDTDVARDRMVLEAYNRRLAELNCPTYDLAAELKPRDFRETPRARPAPKADVQPASTPSAGQPPG